MEQRIKLEGVRENDRVFLTKEAMEKSPELAREMPMGGVVRRVDKNGIAEVEITRIEKIDLSKLTRRAPKTP